MPQKSKRRRQAAEKSRSQILGVALRLVAKNGWSGTSFQMIADQCKVSQSNVIYHFKSKEDLLLGLVERISENNYGIVQFALKPEHDAFERLCLHFQKNLEWAEDHPEEAQIIISIYQQATFNSEFSKLFVDILTRAQSRIYEHLLSGVREKIFHLSLDPETLTKMLHNLLVGAFINICSGRLQRVKNYSAKEWQAVIGVLTGYDEA